jgi:hypothetical protein
MVNPFVATLDGYGTVEDVAEFATTTVGAAENPGENETLTPFEELPRWTMNFVVDGATQSA